MPDKLTLATVPVSLKLFFTALLATIVVDFAFLTGTLYQVATTGAASVTPDFDRAGIFSRVTLYLIVSGGVFALSTATEFFRRAIYPCLFIGGWCVMLGGWLIRDTPKILAVWIAGQVLLVVTMAPLVLLSLLDMWTKGRSIFTPR